MDNVAAGAAGNAGTLSGIPTPDFNSLIAEQQAQMQATMNYQSESAKLNMEFQMHKASTDRLNSMAEAIGNTAQQTSQQLAS